MKYKKTIINTMLSIGIGFVALTPFFLNNNPKMLSKNISQVEKINDNLLNSFSEMNKSYKSYNTHETKMINSYQHKYKSTNSLGGYNFDISNEIVVDFNNIFNNIINEKFIEASWETVNWSTLKNRWAFCPDADSSQTITSKNEVWFEDFETYSKTTPAHNFIEIWALWY
ncbi:MAG: hypothetical protein ACRC4M_05255, partial [Mycoplasma sp.]